MKTFLLLVLCLLALTACGQPPASNLPAFDTLPQGDASRGETLFRESVGGAPTCASCHHLTGETLVGPGLAGYGARAAQRVAGLSAGEYTLQSILNPSAYLVSGYNNLMYDGYIGKFSEPQLADLITYLLSK